MNSFRNYGLYFRLLKPAVSDSSERPRAFTSQHENSKDLPHQSGLDDPSLSKKAIRYLKILQCVIAPPSFTGECMLLAVSGKTEGTILVMTGRAF